MLAYNRISTLYDMPYSPTENIKGIFSYDRGGHLMSSFVYNKFVTLTDEALRKEYINYNLQGADLCCLLGIKKETFKKSYNEIKLYVSLMEPKAIFVTAKIVKLLVSEGFFDSGMYIKLNILADNITEMFETITVLNTLKEIINIESVVISIHEKSNIDETQVTDLISKMYKYKVSNLIFTCSNDYMLAYKPLSTFETSYDINIIITSIINESTLELDANKYTINGKPAGLLPIKMIPTLPSKWSRIFISQNSLHFGSEIYNFDHGKHSNKYINIVITSASGTKSATYLLSKLIYSLHLRRN